MAKRTLVLYFITIMMAAINKRHRSANDQVSTLGNDSTAYH